MENSIKNKLFFVSQIEAFLDVFPIGEINKEGMMLCDINSILRYYIEFLQDCIVE